jgi:hypothetical protein
MVTPRVRPMRRPRLAAALAPWRVDCLARARPAWGPGARGLPRAPAAVPAALTRPDRHGQGEAQLPTCTLPQRPSHGRAKLDRLRQRLLHAASGPHPRARELRESPTSGPRPMPR